MKELKRERALSNPPKKRDIVKDVLSAKSIIKTRSLETQGSITKRSDHMIVLESTRKRSNGMDPKKYLGKRPTMGLIDGSDLIHGLGKEDSKVRFVQDLRHRLANQILKEAEERNEASLPTSSRVFDSSLESDGSYLLELEADPVFEADSFSENDPLFGVVELDDISLDNDVENHHVTPDRIRSKGSFLRRQRAVSSHSGIQISEVANDNGNHSNSSPRVVEEQGTSPEGLTFWGASLSSAPDTSSENSSQIIEELTALVNKRYETDWETDNQTDKQTDRETDKHTYEQTDDTPELLVDSRPNKKDEIILTWLYSQNRSSEESGY